MLNNQFELFKKLGSEFCHGDNAVYKFKHKN